MTIIDMRVAVTIDDFERFSDFYVNGLGFEPGPVWEGTGRGQLFKGGGASLELFDEQYAEGVDQVEVGKRVSGPIRFAFEVDDIQSAVNAAIKHGGKLVHEPIETPWGDINARISAPDGLQITLYQILSKE